jgi:sphinganine-1-phosphate aldolase
MSAYPYALRFEIHRNLPEIGLSREAVLSQLRTMAGEEDMFWETGKCSGTMYCGSHDHSHFMNEAFGLFAHVNVLQRDMFPECHQVRSRNHLNDTGPAARRSGADGG